MEAQRPQVVISGISGRYPQSDNLEELKNNLFAGVDMVTADDSRWPIGLFNLPSRNGKIKSMDKFDNEFFDIPKNKTDLVDPQERILLELTYEAMLDAGVDPKSLKGTKTGVYLGQCFVETHEDFDDPQRAPEMMRQSVTRIANHFEFKGPILLVDTACGSSLSAFNEAFLAIRYGICDQAVVCGSNTLFRPRVSMQFKDLKMVNKDGCCKCLDASANGYVRSEAAISLLLQRSKDSKRIYAKVLNSKSNSDGSKVEGITFPSRVSQAKLCRETYQEAGINVNDIKYVEAHVTGTSAGDPVEMGALFDVICQNRDDPIHVGCIKAAIGHTEGASGLCGISKALIVMQNQLIPPNIHYHSPNLNIEGLVTKKMLPVTRATPLIGDIIPVNCFGFGGANTHVVLQGHFDKSRENKVSGPLPRLIPICGRTVKATKHLGSKLESEPVHWTNEFLSLVNDFSRSASDKFPFRSYCIISEHDSTKAFFKQEPEQVQNSPVWLVLRLEENNGLDMSRLLALDYIKDTMVGLQKPLEQFNINLEQILGENQSKYEDESMVIRYVKTMALQVAYIKLLKWLNFQVSGIVGYSVGLIAKAYHDGQLESDEAILLAYYAALYHDDEIRMKQSFQQVLGSSENSRLSNAQLCDIIESVVRPSQGLNGTPKGVLVIEAGVNGLHEKEKTCTFKPCPLMVTMKTLGQLYMNGNLLAIEKLYPAVKYPLPSTTPSLSSLIQWDHSATWAMKPYLIQNTNTYQTTKKVKFHFDRRTVEDVFLFDHKIDDKVLFPATGYLMMVWSAFSSVTNFAIFEIPIEFRDVVFCRATVMNNQETSFEITISETSGNFEVKESDTVVVKGNIRIDAHSLNKVEPEPVADDVVTLSGKDIYKEFRVRGYDYGQYFQGLSEAKANGREGKITWRDIISESTKDTLNLELEADFANLWLRSWIPFVDAMFQLDILKEENDSRSLFVPTRIESMRINPAKMRQNIEQSPKFLDPLTMNQSSVLNVYGRFDNLTWTDGLLVKGLKTTLLKRRPQQNRLFRYSMIPYSDNNAISDQKKKTIDSYVLNLSRCRERQCFIRQNCFRLE
ncbi:Fatty acid synthase [Halotydeus destructor]|nr:Fatty acid synthase [Halotydeus destructor]